MNETRQIASILVVDDNPLHLQAIMRALANAGFATTHALNGMEAMKCLDILEFNAVVSDVRMPYMDGIELLQRIRARFERMPVILVSGLIDAEIRDAASRWSATALFQKPVDCTALILALKVISRDPERLGSDFARSESEAYGESLVSA